MTLHVSPQTRRVFYLSLPIFAELLLQLLVGNMDQFMISHFGSAAVASIGNGNQVMNVVIIVLETMSAATTILLTQHIGAGKTGDACNEIATVGTAVSAVFSLGMGLLLLLAPEVLFTLLRTPAESFSGACLYTRIVGGAVRSGERLRGNESSEHHGKRHFDQRLLRSAPHGRGGRCRVHLYFQGNRADSCDLDPAA